MKGASVHHHREPRLWEWELSLPVLSRFQQLAARLAQLEVDDPESMTLREEIRRLPGFPQEMHPWDTVHWVLTSKSVSAPRMN